MLLELHGKGGTLCHPARSGLQHCPLVVRPTSEDNVTAHLVQALRTLDPRLWVSDLLNTALGVPRFRRQTYRRFRVDPWVGKPPFPGDLIPWAEGGTEVDVQLTWENPPTTVFVEAKYGSPLSPRTRRNDGRHGFPGDQLARNVRVGLHECGYYRGAALFDAPPREFAVVVLAPEVGQPLVARYRDPETLRAAIPHSDRIAWPSGPLVGEVGYDQLCLLLRTMRRFATPPERRVIDALTDYLTYKRQTKPARTAHPLTVRTGEAVTGGSAESRPGPEQK